MSFFKKLWKWVSNLFSSLETKSQDDVKKAVELVDKIKNFAGGPHLDVITAIIPGEWDNQAKEKIRAWLPTILIQLNATADCLDIQDTNRRMICAIKSINASTDEAKNAFYHSIAILLVRTLSDKKLTWSDAVLVVEWYYTNVKKTK